MEKWRWPPQKKNYIFLFVYPPFFNPTPSPNTPLKCNYSNITLESDNLPEINFTYLLPSLRVQEQDNGQSSLLQ